MCDCPTCPFSLSPVLVELQQADLLTSEECEELRQPRDVVTFQSDKSLEVQTKSADVLRRHGFEKESNLLACKQTQPIIYMCLWCVVQ